MVDEMAHHFRLNQLVSSALAKPETENHCAIGLFSDQRGIAKYKRSTAAEAVSEADDHHTKNKDHPHHCEQGMKEN
jgi:hypothetical protein